MNNKINTLDYLIQSTKEKFRLLENYNIALENYDTNGDNNYIYLKKPSKQSIKDNLKLIRRITLEIEKEL